MKTLNELLPKSEATASELLSANETLALLERLRKAVHDAVTRANQLESDFKTASARLQSQFEYSLENEKARWTSQSDAEKTGSAQTRERIQATYTSRKARIARALENSRKRRIGQVDNEESTKTVEVQHALLEADRKRDADTEANKTNHADLTARLTEEGTVLQQMEARARTVLGAYGSFRRLLASPPSSASLDFSAHESKLIERLHERLEQAGRALGRCQAMVLPMLFRFLPIWLWVILILALPFALSAEARRFDFASVPPKVWGIVVGSLAGAFVLYFLGKALAGSSARAAAAAIGEARQLYDACARKAEESFARETERIRNSHASTKQSLNDSWKQAMAQAKELRSSWTSRIETQAGRVEAANEEWRGARVQRLEAGHSELTTRSDQETAQRRKELERLLADNLAKLMATSDAGRKAVEEEWQSVVLPTRDALVAAGVAAEEAFPPWRAELWEQFSLPDDFAAAAKFAELTVDVEKLAEVTLPADLPWPNGKTFTLPLLLTIPRNASILFETKSSGHEQIIGALNNLVLRLLTSSPPGKLNFTIFDPVGLGQNFAGIMHLADFEERLINSRIWTQQAQFEQRLADLNEHIEKVTQMYLRNEYQSLAEYNENAGRLAEKYQFLVIADFPANFSELAVKRLMSIAASGPRCGVYLLIHWDQRRAAPAEFVPEELRKSSLSIVPKGEGFAFASAPWGGLKLALDAPPDADLATKLLQQIGKDSTDSFRVEMPFEEVVPDDDEIWSLDTTSELRVPVGRTGATKLQYLALGQGTRQHGLVAGKTGSGKSTLFHVIITNLSLWCSPQQVEFYLVDFKKGVEFKCYASNKLPHARVIAIESDREFGLSVLQRVDDELRRRGDLFRKLGAQDIAGYKRAGGLEPMPRVLLLIDEFQELFVEDDRVSQGAALLLDRIVRQGRAFGVHVLLGSQTLGGAYTLARATIGQMVVRIALQCNEADAYLIMNEDNPAPRLLSRPGEAIYNDDGGTIQGNSPFQVVWLPDAVRDTWLAKVHGVAKQKHVTAEPIVFEGNAPASIRDNLVLRDLLASPATTPTSTGRIWLGAPNSIKGPTEAAFRRQSGNHLLIVGQREEAALGMLATALISLSAQYPKGAVRFFVFDTSPPDSAEAQFLERVAGIVPHEIKLVRAGETEEVMTALAADLQKRADEPGAVVPETFLLIHGLQRNKKLRYDEEMSFSLDADTGANPGLQLNKLIVEGAALGFHVIAASDTYNNVMRFLSRKALSEFEIRIVFQMSANDSASLIESPAANNLGLHRAILFNGHEGWTETFRPYALLDNAWLDEAGGKLKK